MNFVFFSPVAWDNMGGANRPAGLAAEMVRRGIRTLFVELERSRAAPATANPRVFNLEQLGMSPVCVLSAYYGFDYGALDQARAALLRILDGWETRDAKFAVFSAPFRPFLEFLPLLKKRGYRILFDVLDDYSAMRALGYFCFDAEAEQFLARHCDLALPLSPPLQQKVQAYGAPRVCLLRDGVDLDVFRRPPGGRPVSLARGEITLGFWGWIWPYNVDIPLLSHVALTRPRWEIHLVGPFDPAAARALELPNVHFHGKVAQAQLRGYAEQFDVCLLLSPDDAFNRARDPLKLYEYLACHKPVVASNLPELGEAPYVYVSHDADEFVSHVERAAATPVDAARLDAFLSEQTWAKRGETLLDAVAALPEGAGPTPEPPRGAMPGADGELERWRAYALHLEKLAALQQTALAESGLSARLKRRLRR